MPKTSKKLLQAIARAQSVAELPERVVNGKCVYVKGAVGALKPLLVAHLSKQLSRPVVYFSHDREESEEVKEDLERLLGEEAVAHFPAFVLYGSGFDHHNHDSLRARLKTLEALTKEHPAVIVAHCSGLLHRLPLPEIFSQNRISVRPGKEVEFDKLVALLVDMGFVRETRVEHPGEMCVRGGIVDVFPYSAESPYRIEFWGESVESLRKFDPETQRSVASVERLDIFPQDIESTEQESSDARASLLDYLPEQAIVVFDEPDRILRSLALELRTASDDEEAMELAEAAWRQVETRLARTAQMRFVSVGSKYPRLVSLDAKSPQPFKGDLKAFRTALTTFAEEKLNGHDHALEIYYSCDSESQAERLQEIFADEEIVFPGLSVTSIGLHKGFVFPEASLIVYTDHQFYGRTKRLRLPKRRFKGLNPNQLKHLNVGDYVVHVDYGIGVFRGLKKIAVHGHERECLQIEYRDGDMVYVRIERMDRVNKHSSKDTATPPLSKLGSAEWQKLKMRTKKKIKDIAKDLIEIYARRRSQPGFAFEADGLWQRELEASFPYDDTPDQVTATVEVKQDMESPRPMDRLICGDVGFGKTEIAVRAAFKAVLGGKQVAMLVPTTILAYQHLNTFRERLAKFPVQVEMLSRFRTRAEQKVILEKLAAGEVDIVIGTHRLLSKDVQFKALGLLIVDEEHRFGVTHKEKLRRFRATIDVLTLTATPIPRTLQFSLMGARDMTLITTPPKNRLPIITEILPFSPRYVREVILRELDRRGQAFFVHNRVKSINRIAEMVSDLVPEARVAVAHGQMPEKELEKVMVDFIEKKYEILVSTMIIESGLDMPNVNTIIVNRADKLGLAQLYQLRGRVGRSHQRAYAYFIIPPIERLTDDALKRLRSIEEFSDIGSGTQLAMRDLEIRGAGNLLGAEQTGFIDTLGFDLYNKILDEAIQELKAERLPQEAKKPSVETLVEMDLDAYLPENYVAAGPERVDIYRRLTGLQALQEITEIWAELEDRFGKLPQPVKNLLTFVAIRRLGQHLGLKMIRITKREMIAEYSPEILDTQGEQFHAWLGSTVANASLPFEFFQNEGLGIRLQIPDTGDKLLLIKEFLQSLDPGATNPTPVATQ
ncbi:MAG: transcription-repair coupling factor [Caldithrix sp.]|nr:MAG: transcription-repair coupling factor [Caldithrix sp.]